MGEVRDDGDEATQFAGQLVGDQDIMDAQRDTEA